MRQCFRYESLYVPGARHSLFVFHFYVKIVYVVFANKYNTKKLHFAHELLNNALSSMTQVTILLRLKRADINNCRAMLWSCGYNTCGCYVTLSNPSKHGQ